MAFYRAQRGSRLLTLEEFERLPDDGDRLELSRGRLVREPQPSAEHGLAAQNLHDALREFLRGHPLGRLVFQCGFLLSDEPPTVRGPDLAFIRAERLPPKPPTGFWPFAPDIAVEVVSPANSAADLQQKVAEYIGAGTRQVWVVYPRTRSVVAHLAGGEARVLGEDAELEGGEMLPGFHMHVADIFAY
jgi:Uma2 family endonuclease